MRRIKGSLQAVIAMMLLGGLLTARPGPVAADAVNNPSLIISQLKITSSDGQFITLYNATDSALDMGKYQLEYFNSYDLGKATSSRLLTLSGTVPPHGYYVVSDDSLLMCYRQTVDSVSLGLSSTSGMVEVLALDQLSPGFPTAPKLQDYVSWSKKDANGAQTLPVATGAFLQRSPMDSAGGPLVDGPGTGGWQTVTPDSTNPCNLVISGSGGTLTITSGSGQLLPALEPPATILDAGDAGDAGAAGPAMPSMPPADIGLRAPVITEILPNPAGTGNDSSEEFIELYNPNDRTFDLSGFSLQSGITSLHIFTMPAGASLPPRSFKAFYSADTGLSLSNTAGQVKLLDPFGNSISTTAEYAKAKDGIAWALAKGKWYWTLEVTPGKANFIKQPSGKAKSAASKSHDKVGGNTLSAAKNDKSVNAAGGTDQAATNPIHLRTLVLVAGLALLYGAYEYRADLANRVYRIRQHFGARYEDRA